jgi:putative transposase
MPRPYRLQVAGGVYHLFARANTGRVAFSDDDERAQFLGLVAEVVRRCEWSCRAYCVLSTHYHLVMLTPEPDLSAGMQYLNGRYAQWANWRRGERGHVFDGRFGSVLVRTAEHSLELHRYIALNPVRAGLVRRPEDWPWSSLPAVLGSCDAEPFLDVAAVVEEFGPGVITARRRLRTFLRDGIARDMP